MKEKQINSIPFRPHSEPLLSGNKCKVIAQLQQKLLQFSNKRFFQFCLGVFVFESQEFEDERIFDLEIGSLPNGTAFEAGGVRPLIGER